MTKYLTHYIYPILLLSLCCYSCQTYHLITLEQMHPAELYFPEEVKKAAIITTIVPQNHSPEKVSVSETIQGDGQIAAESLAQNLATENYFEQIVISDSIIREGDTQEDILYLSQKKVKEICNDLDSEILISIEDLKLTPKNIISQYLPYIAQHYYSVDMEVSPLIRIYLPEKKLPLYTISPKDTIFWESYGLTDKEAQRKLVSLSTAIRESSEYAGTFPVKYIVPYWETTERFFYTGGSAEMRDAFVYARRYEWDAAILRWHKAFEKTTKKKKKLRAAYNLAVGYELKGEVEQADTWFETALSYIKNDEIESITEGFQNNMRYTDDTILLYFFNDLLKKRKGELTKLNIQMKRFEKEN